MRRLKMLPLTLLCLFVLSGCYAFPNPLFTEKEAIFEPGLLGRYASLDGKGIFWVKRDRLKKKEYVLTIHDKNGKIIRDKNGKVDLSNVLFLRLGKIGNHYFVNCTDWVRSKHQFLRLSVVGNTLRLRPFGTPQ